MNLANKITMTRVAIIPIFMYFLLNSKSEYAGIIALILFIVASLTDALDGYIARSRNLITNFGKFIDPLADKLLVSAALISLVELDKISAWVTFIIIAREFAISGLRILAASKNKVIAASKWGKVKTVMQIVTITILLSDNITKYINSITNIPATDILIGLTVIATLLSGIDYLNKNKEVF